MREEKAVQTEAALAAGAEAGLVRDDFRAALSAPASGELPPALDVQVRVLLRFSRGRLGARTFCKCSLCAVFAGAGSAPFLP